MSPAAAPRRLAPGVPLVICSMPLRIHSVVLTLGAFLLAGCSTAPAKKTAGAAESAGPGNDRAAAADYSPAIVKARIESHAHYAAAVLHEQNDEPELAAEEFYLAAMADPANESHDEGVLWNAESESHLLAGAPGEASPVEPACIDAV